MNRGVVDEFRRTHPEHEAGFHVHPKVGLCMDEATAKAFIAWAEMKGYTTPQAAERTSMAMKIAIANAKPIDEVDN